LSQQLNTHAENGWSLSKLVPTMTSQGSVVKLIVTLTRDKKTKAKK